MKKSLLLLAIASAFAGSAFADNVSVYGVVDMGITHESGDAGSKTKMSSGVASQSRIGFKGEEALGNGLSAVFQLETGFQADSGKQLQADGATADSRLFGRQAFVGLVSKDLGSVTLGRQYSFHFETLRDIADPFATGLAGRANNLVSTPTRTDNLLKYVSPTFGGFTAKAAYGFGEVAGDRTASRTLGLSLNYANGPLAAAVSYNDEKNAAGTDSTKNTLVAGSYDLGVAKANLGVGFNKGVGSADSRDYILGVTVPFGATKVLASYVRKDDRDVTNQDANQIGVGVMHSLSKRTDLYASYARISNTNGASYKASNNSETGFGDKQFNVGVRHSF